MKVVYKGEGSGVVVGGLYLEPDKPVEVSDKLGKILLKNPNIKVLKERTESKTKNRKGERTEW